MKKSTCPEEVDFCVKKRPKSEIRQNLIQLNEVGPNPASNDCQRRRSPRASIDCQEKEPQSQQCQEVIPNPAKIDCREPRGYPRHPGALTCHRDTLKGVTRGQQSAQTQEVTRGSIQIRFLAVIQPRRPVGGKGAYFVTPAPTTSRRPSAPTTSRRPSAPAVEAKPHQVLIHGVHPRFVQAGGHDPRLSGKYKLLTY